MVKTNTQEAVPFSSSNYFEQQIFEQEQRHLFSAKENDLFLGHHSMVKEKGDYFVIPHTGNTHLLIHDGEQANILSNVCQHRHALMLEGSGNVKKIVCPMHLWSYGLDGGLKGSPGIECDPKQHSLSHIALDAAQGFFSTAHNPRLLNAFKAVKKYTNIDFDTVRFIGHGAYENPINWKEYVDTFLDCYHVSAIHPGLGSLADCRKMETEFGEDFQIHTVPPFEGYQKRVVAEMKDYVDCYASKFNDLDDRYAAVWITIYPNILVEIYQEFLVINAVEPVDVKTSRIHSYKFCTPRVFEHKDLIDALGAMLDQVEVEDNILMKRIHEGRKWRFKNHDDFDGPYHEQREGGIRHFQDYIRRGINQA